MPEWIVPFSGRNPSVSQELNFLWQHGNVYFMDNHRAAAWCWFRHLPRETRARLIHIDQHYDTAWVDPSIAAAQAALLRGDLQQYLDALHPDPHLAAHEIRLFAWDNYIPIAAASCPCAFESFVFFTSDVGSPPHRLGARTRRLTVKRVTSTLAKIPPDVPLIVNIDLDYVFNEDQETPDGYSARVLPDGAVRRLAAWTRSVLDTGQALVATIALSPECCDGWPEAERLAAVFAHEMGEPFALP